MMQFCKKAVAVLLAVLCLLSLNACSRKDDGEVTLPQGSYDEGGRYKPTVPDVSEKLAELEKENSDVVAWLQVPNTTINEAVVQTTNNTFYLRRDVYKKYSYEGCYYMDYESVMFDDGADLAQNTIIYGHNLGNPMGSKDDPEGVKFAQLLKFDDEEIAKATPYIYLTTKSGVHIFEIFAVFYSEDVLTPVPYHYAEYTFDQFEQLIKDVKARSQYIYDVEVTPEDRIISLSTCSYKFGTYSQNPRQRYVVMGRLVKDGESYHETANFTVNPTPKQPIF